MTGFFNFKFPIKSSLALLTFTLLHADEATQSKSPLQAVPNSTISQGLISDTARAISIKSGFGMESDLYKDIRLSIEKSLIDRSGTYDYTVGLEGALSRSDTALKTGNKLKTDRSFGLDYGVTAGLDYNFTNSHALGASLFLGKGTRIYQRDFDPVRRGIRDIEISYSSIKSGFDIDYKYQLTNDMQLSAGLGYRRSSFTADSTAELKRPLGFRSQLNDHSTDSDPLPFNFTSDDLLYADKQLQEDVARVWPKGIHVQKAAGAMLGAIAVAVSNIAGQRNIGTSLDPERPAVARQSMYGWRLPEGWKFRNPHYADAVCDFGGDVREGNCLAVKNEVQPIKRDNQIGRSTITCDYQTTEVGDGICAPNTTYREIQSSIGTIHYAASLIQSILAESGFDPREVRQWEETRKILPNRAIATSQYHQNKNIAPIRRTSSLTQSINDILNETEQLKREKRGGLIANKGVLSMIHGDVHVWTTNCACGLDQLPQNPRNIRNNATLSLAYGLLRQARELIERKRYDTVVIRDQRGKLDPTRTETTEIKHHYDSETKAEPKIIRYPKSLKSLYARSSGKTLVRTRSTTNRVAPQVGISYRLGSKSEVYARYKMNFDIQKSALDISSLQYVTFGYRYHF